jgi:hypothetical protein
VVQFLGYALIRLLGTTSSALFFFLFGICVYWYLFFKVQGAVYVFLPTTDSLAPFVAVLVIAFVGKVCILAIFLLLSF